MCGLEREASLEADIVACYCHPGHCRPLGPWLRTLACLSTEPRLLPTVSIASSREPWVSLLMLSSMLLLAIFSYSSNTVERCLLLRDMQISV